MGDALDINILAKNKKEIIALNKEISTNFKRAYRFLGSAKWRSLPYPNLSALKILFFKFSIKL